VAAASERIGRVHTLPPCTHRARAKHTSGALSLQRASFRHASLRSASVRRVPPHHASLRHARLRHAARRRPQPLELLEDYAQDYSGTTVQSVMGSRNSWEI